MEINYTAYVIDLLENHCKAKRQMKLLRYEIEHVRRIAPTEMIEIMTFQACGADAKQESIYPKDVPEIALSYQRTAAQLNQEATDELASKYADLCGEQDRLLHYISLLENRQQTVIRKYYFDLSPWSEIADSMNLTVRTAQRIRQQAVDELANLYAFADGIFGVKSAKEKHHSK